MEKDTEDFVISSDFGDTKAKEPKSEPQGMKCPECGKDIDIGTEICPNCGFPLAKTKQLQQDNLIGNIMIIAFLGVIILVVGFLLFSCINHDDTEEKQKTVQETTKSKKSSKSKNKTTKKKEKAKVKAKSKKKVSSSKLTKAQYIKKCKKLYYNNVFFGKKNLTGELVKLDVFVKDMATFEPYSLSDYDFKDKWKPKRIVYVCSVKRKNKNSYAGMGEVDLFFSNKKAYKINTSNIGSGSKFTIYGEVFSWSNSTYDGYNDVQVMVRFAEGV